MKKIKIDPEFKALIPPLSADEFAALEENLLRNGCRHALIVWDGYLVDGHNRYEICEKHGIAFHTTPLEFKDTRESVMAWMIDNQLARRNVIPFQRIELASKKAGLIAALAQKKKTAGSNQHSSLPSNLTEGSALDTRTEVAKAAGVSAGTISKFKKIKECAVPAVIEKARSGEIKMDVAAQVASLPKEEQITLAAKGKDAMKAAAKAVRQASKQAKCDIADVPLVKGELTDTYTEPDVSSPQQDDDELIRLRAENEALRNRVKELITASEFPQVDSQLADALANVQQLTELCAELTSRVAALKKENDKLVRRQNLLGHTGCAGHQSSDASNIDAGQVKEGAASPAEAPLTPSAPWVMAQASTAVGACVNSAANADLHALDLQHITEGSH